MELQTFKNRVLSVFNLLPLLPPALRSHPSSFSPQLHRAPAEPHVRGRAVASRLPTVPLQGRSSRSYKYTSAPAVLLHFVRDARETGTFLPTGHRLWLSL